MNIFLTKQIVTNIIWIFSIVILFYFYKKIQAKYLLVGILINSLICLCRYLLEYHLNNNRLIFHVRILHILCRMMNGLFYFLFLIYFIFDILLIDDIITLIFFSIYIFFEYDLIIIVAFVISAIIYRRHRIFFPELFIQIFNFLFLIYFFFDISQIENIVAFIFFSTYIFFEYNLIIIVVLVSTFIVYCRCIYRYRIRIFFSELFTQISNNLRITIGITETYSKKLNYCKYYDGKIIYQQNKQLPVQNYNINIEKKCVICCEDYINDDDIILLKCQHYYHKKCCISWLYVKNTCPICRTQIL